MRRNRFSSLGRQRMWFAWHEGTAYYMLLPEHHWVFEMESTAEVFSAWRRARDV